MEHDTEKRLEVPNEETVAAMKEAEEMTKNPEKYKTYHSLDDLMRDLP